MSVTRSLSRQREDGTWEYVYVHGWPRPLTREMHVYVTAERIRRRAFESGVVFSNGELTHAAERVALGC